MSAPINLQWIGPEKWTLVMQGAWSGFFKNPLAFCPKACYAGLYKNAARLTAHDHFGEAVYRSYADFV